MNKLCKWIKRLVRRICRLEQKVEHYEEAITFAQANDVKDAKEFLKLNKEKK